jgi:hypothetical protein
VQKMTFFHKVLIFSYIAFVLLLSAGCKSLETIPITHVYVIDTDHGVCSKRRVTDKKTLASVRVADLPLEACDGNVSITAKEFLDTRTWLKQEGN